VRRGNLRRAGFSLVSAVMLVLMWAVPAHAFPHYFTVPAYAPRVGCNAVKIACATGIITWYNRTARIDGFLRGPQCPYLTHATAVFEAYAGATKIDAVSSPRARCDTLADWNPYTFPIGDTNLRGGINRIKITVCTDPDWVCGTPINHAKPAA